MLRLFRFESVRPGRSHIFIFCLAAICMCRPPEKQARTRVSSPAGDARLTKEKVRSPAELDPLSRALMARHDFVDLSADSGLVLEIRYATTDNFVGENLYGDFRRCFLHKEAAVKLRRAVDLLRRERPGWKLLIFDCLRPRSVQRRLREKVRGTPEQAYVADPAAGSVHNFGFAVDLSLVDANGREVDMGTPYDSFQPLAQPKREAEFLKQGRLSKQQHRHRLLLRRVMTGAGFRQLPHEWWHYDAQPGKVVRAKYKIVE